MAKRFIQLPKKLTVELRDTVTDEPIPEAEIASNFPRSWAHMVRIVCQDPRLLEYLDIFEINEVRALARALPGSVHEIEDHACEAMLILLSAKKNKKAPPAIEKSMVPGLFFSSGGVEFVRVFADATTKDPRPTAADVQPEAAAVS